MECVIRNGKSGVWKMNNKLNLESFNEILFKAIDNDKHIELLEIELQTAYLMKVQKMEELVFLINKGEPYQETLKQVNNIDSNCNSLAEMLEKLKSETKNEKKND